MKTNNAHSVVCERLVRKHCLKSLDKALEIAYRKGAKSVAAFWITSAFLKLSVLLFTGCVGDGGRSPSIGQRWKVPLEQSEVSQLRSLIHRLNELGDGAETAYERATVNRRIAEIHSANRNAETAITHFQKAIELYQRVERTGSEQAETFVLLGFEYADFENHANAIKSYREALRLYPENRTTRRKRAIIYSALGKSLSTIGETEAALNAFDTSMQYYRQTPGGDKHVAAVMADSGRLRFKTGNIRGGLKMMRDAELMYAQIPEADQERAGVLRNIGESLLENKDTNAALTAYAQAMKVYARLSDDKRDRLRAEVLEVTGRIRLQQDDVKAAHSDLSEAIQLYQRYPHDGDDETCAAILVLLGYLLNEMEDYTGAVEQYAKALPFYRQQPARQLEIAHIYSNYGFSLAKVGRLDEAILNYHLGINIYTNRPGRELDGAELLVRIGSIENVLDRHTSALNHLKEAQNIYASKNVTDRDRAVLLINQAVAYRGLGRYGQALFLDEQAIKLLTSLTNANRELARAYRGCGVAFAALEKPKQAIQSYERAIQLLIDLPNTEVDRAQLLNNIVNRLSALHGPSEDLFVRYAEALDTLNDKERFWRERAVIFNNLGNLQEDLNKSDAAANTYREAIELVRGRTQAGPLEALLYNNLGAALDRLGTEHEAHEAFRTAVSLYDGIPGADDLKARALANLGESLAKRGESDEAIMCSFEGLQLAWNFLIGNGSALSAAEKREFFGRNIPSADILYGLCARTSTRANVGLEAALLRKGILFELARHEHNIFFKQGSPKSLGSIVELQELRRQAAAISIRLRSVDIGEPFDTASPRLAELNAQISDIEADLRGDDVAFDSAMMLQRTGLKDIEPVIKPGEVLLEYVQFGDAAWGNGPAKQHYAVFILDGRDKRVRALELGPIDQINRIVQGFRDRIKFDTEDPARVATRVSTEGPLARLGGSVRKVIIDPIFTNRSWPDRIYIAPEGPMALVPFESLAMKRGANGWEYLGERVEIIYMTSARDIARKSLQHAPKSNRAILIGNPDFNASTKSLVSAVREQLAHKAGNGKRPEREEVDDAHTGVHLPDSSAMINDAPTWTELRDTGPFLDRLSGQLQRLGLRTSVLQGTHAVEEAFVFRPCARVVQFATHGAFFKGSGRFSVDQNNNSLLASTLALAGANNREARPVLSLDEERSDVDWATPQRIYGTRSVQVGDGLLTAFEISGMDLRCTELLCLTACESGLGTPEAGEGVIGLRQAFLEAGCQSMIMSLCPVPTDATLKQMDAFYESWLTEGSERYKAFRRSQLLALARAREEHGSGHPFWWAGFVYIGDPGDSVTKN